MAETGMSIPQHTYSPESKLKMRLELNCTQKIMK
jgi:hypothetical protein